MKIRPLSRQQVRSIDSIAIQQYGIPGVVLMENAGAGAARVIQRVAAKGRVAILCGKGNNAGDGYVIARHLELADRDVNIVSVVDPDELVGDAKINFQIARHSQLPIQTVTDSGGQSQAVDLEEALSGADVIIDCLLGTGATGAPRGIYADAVRIANQHQAQRIAIDVPTGIDCDSGEVSAEAFRASHTITFVAPKLAMQNSTAAPLIGTVHTVCIGVPRQLLVATANDGSSEQ